MNGLLLLFIVTSIIGAGIAIWLNTKAEKKWLSNL